MSDRGYVNPQLLWEPAEVHARLNDPQLCLIDTRAGEEYAQGHIPGAQLFDLFGISLSDTDPAPLKAFSWMIEYMSQARAAGLVRGAAPAADARNLSRYPRPPREE
jgi:3-mercaptopyruvate sulfurtransferase SseA